MRFARVVGWCLCACKKLGKRRQQTERESEGRSWRKKDKRESGSTPSNSQPRKLARSPPFFLCLARSSPRCSSHHVVLLPLRLAHSQHGPKLHGSLVPAREQPVREEGRETGGEMRRDGEFQWFFARSLAPLSPENLGLSTNLKKKNPKLARPLSRWSERMKAEDPGYFDRLKNQQAPKYLWIGCADSRVPVRIGVAVVFFSWAFLGQLLGLSLGFRVGGLFFFPLLLAQKAFLSFSLFFSFVFSSSPHAPAPLRLSPSKLQKKRKKKQANQILGLHPGEVFVQVREKKKRARRRGGKSRGRVFFFFLPFSLTWDPLSLSLSIFHNKKKKKLLSETSATSRSTAT